MRQWGKLLGFTSTVAFLLFVAVPRAAQAAPPDGCTDVGCAERCCISGNCVVTRYEAGTVCRAPTAPCDAAETCDGVSTTCPDDALSPAGTICRTAAGDCDVAETCTGTSAECPADLVKPGNVICRPAAGPCDEAETCVGPVPGGGGVAADPTICPPENVKKRAGTVCREAAGYCDQAESCDGSSDECPADAALANGTACGSACVSGGTCIAGACLGATPEVDVTPVDAVVQPGSTTVLTVTHSGSGGALSLAGATLDSSAFELVDEPTWPVVLSAGGSTTIGVRLAEAPAPGSYAATVTLAFNECDEPLVVDVSAEVAGDPGSGAATGGSSGGGGCGTPVGSAPTTLAWFLSVVFGLRMMRRSRQ